MIDILQNSLCVFIGQCKIHSSFSKIFKACNEDYMITNEDTDSYLNDWLKPPINHSDVIPLTSPWRYKSTWELDGMPVAKQLTIYNGGGYCVDLVGSLERVNEIILDLGKSQWIDRLTRAVFIEFTVYSANTNMFSSVALNIEFSSSNLVVHSWRVDSFRLFSYVGSSAVLVLISEIVYVICIVYFTAALIKRFKREKISGFFRSFWNVIETSNLIMSYTAIVMYVGRHVYTIYAINSIKKLKSKNAQKCVFISMCCSAFNNWLHPHKTETLPLNFLYNICKLGIYVINHYKKYLI